MIPIRFADQTDRALFETLTHIAQDDPVAAMGLIEDLQRRVIQTLGQFPDAGMRTAGGQRFLTIRGYAFLYRNDVARSW